MGGTQMRTSYKYLGIVTIIFCILMGTSIGVVGEKEDLPDLIITDIHFHGFMFFEALHCTVKNIGDAPVNGRIRMSSSFHRIYFNPLNRTYTINYNLLIPPGTPLKPGESVCAEIIEGSKAPGTVFGFVRFENYVNIDGFIEESNYTNNQYNHTIFQLGGFYPHWINLWLDINYNN